MKFLKAFTVKISHTLVHSGWWGLLGLSFLDSAGVSLPGLKDFLVIYLCGKDPSLAWFYALVCAVGTAAGSYLIYVLGRSGARIFKKKGTEKQMGRAMQWIARNDFVTVLVASLLPPPLPFKPFLVAAGALRMSPLSMLAALMLGGAIRFAAEAWIGVRFGKAGPAYLKKNMVKISVITIGVIVLAALIYRKFMQPSRNPEAAPSEDPPSSTEAH